RLSHPPRRLSNALEGHLKVAIDIVVQCLERRDVENAHAASGGRSSPQVIQTGEEGGQRLARSGWGQNQRVASRRDGRPALPLRWCRFAERLPEPLAHRRKEEIESVGCVHAA